MLARTLPNTGYRYNQPPACDSIASLPACKCAHVLQALRSCTRLAPLTLDWRLRVSVQGAAQLHAVWSAQGEKQVPTCPTLLVYREKNTKAVDPVEVQGSQAAGAECLELLAVRGQ